MAAACHGALPPLRALRGLSSITPPLVQMTDAWLSELRWTLRSPRWCMIVCLAMSNLVERQGAWRAPVHRCQYRLQ